MKKPVKALLASTLATAVVLSGGLSLMAAAQDASSDATIQIGSSMNRRTSTTLPEAVRASPRPSTATSTRASSVSPTPGMWSPCSPTATR